MKNIPTAPRQLVYMALTLFAPLLLTVALLCWAPAKPGQTHADMLVAAGVVGAVILLCAAILAVSAMRHAIDITPDALVVKHSMYTLTVNRADVTSVTVRELQSINEAGLSTRKNGTALFGYYSGWFGDTRGALTFCAVSAHPIYMVTLDGNAPCRQLVLSANPEIARAIGAWVA